MALTGQGSPTPSDTNSQAAASRPASSTLFTTSSTGRAGPSHHPGRRQVLVGHPHRHVDDEQHQVGLVHGPLGLVAHLGLEVAPAGQPAAGVDEGEGDAVPLGVEDLAVPGDPRRLLDHGRPPPDDPVDQRGLADVGPPDHGHQRLHRTASSAARSDAPSLATTSTSTGRSARVVPSRNLPSERQASGSRYAAGGVLAVEGPGEVGPGEEAGHPDVAAEEPVLHGQQPHVAPGQEGPEHPGAVGAGHHGHRPAPGPPGAEGAAPRGAR